MVNIVEKIEPEYIDTLDFAQREQNVRAWIARKESICPYAPGLARFVLLPEINDMRIEHVHTLAHELQAFFDDKQNGKRVGRWMLLPQREWQSHEEAHEYSERLFWLLNAAYFHLIRDRKSVQASLKRELKGYDRGYKGEILNPVIGKLPQRNQEIVPAKSLFYSALSPLYRSKKFYRYSPHSIIPLVYATEFQDLKRKHPKVTKNVCFEMGHSGLVESFGKDLKIDLDKLRTELPIWGAIIDRTAEIMRAKSSGTSSHCDSMKGSPASNLSYFRYSHPRLAHSFYSKYLSELSVLRSIVRKTNVSAKEVIKTAFAGSGLYTIPEYPLG